MKEKFLYSTNDGEGNLIKYFSYRGYEYCVIKSDSSSISEKEQHKQEQDIIDSYFNAKKKRHKSKGSRKELEKFYDSLEI